MRLLFVNHYLEEVGGAEVHLRSLADELGARGHEVAFFAGSPDTERDEPALRVVRRPFFAHEAMLRDETLTKAFLRFARRFRPDVVHAHKLVALPVELVPAFRAARAAVVHTVYDYSLFCPNAWNVWPDGTVCAGGPGRKCFAHGCESNHKYDARVVLAARLRLRLLRRVADAVIAPSEHLAGLCAAHGFARVTQLPYYPPEPAGAPAAENGEPVRVLCVSRLEKEKGVAVLVEALPRLRSLVPGAALALVGAGPEEESLRARVQALGLGDAVEFAGAAPRAALAGHLARAGVLALPSIWCEALPLIAFDAMAAGVPMVGTAIGGIPTVVRDGVTGLLCRPRDPADLAEKLARVLTDPALRDRLRRGAREDLARYDKARHLDALDGVYREARARPRRRLRGAVGGEVRAVLHRLLLRVDELERDNARIQAASVRLDAHRQELEGNVSDLNRRLGDLWHERDRLKGLLHRMASGKLTRLLNRLRGIEGLEEFHIKGK